MKSLQTPFPRLPRQLGMTLIELMIAMTIGLVILGAVSTLFINVRQSFSTAENMSRIQENARYAVEMLARDIRMAGYLGCGNLESISVNTIANAPIEELLFDNVLRGQDSPAGQIAGITLVGADSITIKRGIGSDVHLVGNLVPSNANIQINSNPDNFVAGDVLMVTNCTNADVFRATNVSSGGTITIAHSNSSNTGSRIGTYGEDAFLMRLAQFVFFIGVNPAGRPALYRANTVMGAGAAVAVEIADSVENMEIQYGVDTNGDDSPDEYQTATAITGTNDWDSVVSVKLRLLVVSPDPNVLSAAQSHTFNGTTVSDRRMRQVFTTTIAIRNRLP